MFSFNEEKYDFWPVYEVIKKFYPIGIPRSAGNLFHLYPGLKTLEQIIVDNIHDEAHFKNHWTDFEKEVAAACKLEAEGSTYGQAPCFSTVIIIEQQQLNNLTRTKELHFFVSLAGPFYTVIGRDASLIKTTAGFVDATNYLTVSPVDEYQSAFQTICEKIEQRFKGHRFLPFAICRQTIDGLAVNYSALSPATVYNAIFNDRLLLTADVLGDAFYKSDQWIKEGYIDKGNAWTSYPPLR